MNCLTCQKNLDAYLNGQLPEEIMEGTKTHLNECETCKAAYASLLLSEKVITEEAATKSNPFLATRVMSKIESLESVERTYEPKSVYSRVLQPVLVTVSLAAALLIGVMVGNTFSNTLYNGTMPEELAYLNDGAMESLNLFANE